MMLFLADAGVKVIRRILLCKRSGGDAETGEQGAERFLSTQAEAFAGANAEEIAGLLRSK
jgi:hypothetical protein